MDRGIQVAIVVVCFTMAAGTLGAVGLFADWQVGVDTGQDDKSDDFTQNDSELVDPTVDSNQGIVESFVDTITPGLGIIKTITNSVNGLQALLANIGIPRSIAAPIAAVASIAVGISIVKFIRGYG